MSDPVSPDPQTERRLAPPASPYLRLAPAETAPEGDGVWLSSGVGGPAITLDASEYALARLFDGQRPLAEVLRRAHAELGHAELDRAALLRLATKLGQAGVLQAGWREPLPVPIPDGLTAGGVLAPTVAADAARTGAEPAIAPHTALPLPSALPGTLAVPNLSGALAGLWGPRRGAATGVALELRPFALWLGRLLNWPLANAATGTLVVALTVGAIAVIVNHRYEIGRDLLRLGPALPLVLGLSATGYLVNWLAQTARAAAIARYARSRPRFGLTRGTVGIPYFLTETAGHAELAPYGARMRIVASVPAAELALFLFALWLWLMFHRGGSYLAPLALELGAVSAVLSLVHLNPLVKREGYTLLAQWLRIGDLREQAMMVLMGYSNPWDITRRPPYALLFLYLTLVALYLLWIPLTWLIFPAPFLKVRWGPIGALLVIGILAYFIYAIVNRMSSDRATIREKADVNASQFDVLVGEVKAWFKSAWAWLVRNLWPKDRPWQRYLEIAFVILCLLPYPYDPSGTSVVLPYARGDVRAQIAGQVREVLVKEGDAVKAGQVIAKLDDAQERAAVASGEAEVARLTAERKLVQQGARPEEVEVARQAVATAQKRYDFSSAEARRQQAAYLRHAVSEQQYQQFLSQAEVDRQQLLEAQRRLDLVSSPGRPEKIEEIDAQLAAAQAQLDYHKQQLENTQIRAPVAGRVLSGSLQFAVGDFLHVGDKLATIVDSDHVQVEVKIPEDDIGEISVGNKAWVKVWSLPGTSFRGTVAAIAPSAENGEYGKIVRVTVNLDQSDPRLRPELTGYSKLRGRWHLLIAAYTRPVVRFFLVELWSWIP
ncbi:MAG: HlyD family efflux transporter periplasmic adaptor subunit [Nevskia sp.]|nr:HlyD family efflux transporter periplasmic adaptor subunit [Nevskia sp.]